MDFVIILDVCEGSPNGDPARDNTPRTDPYDGHGLITDVCVKRKIRDYLTDEGAEMLITREPVAINDLLAQTAKTVDPPSSAGAAAKKGKLELDLQGPRAAAVCKRFMDVRLFGAMVETGDYKAGRIRGPLQLSMGRSLHPVRISRHQVTRIAVTKPEDLIKNNTMSDGNGRQIIRYAAYRMLGTYSPRMGAKTGVIIVSEEGDDWKGARKGLAAWNAEKTPGAGFTAGGRAAPLAMLHTPRVDSPDVGKLLARYAKAGRLVLDLGVVDGDKVFDCDPSNRAVREQWNAAHPSARVEIAQEKKPAAKKARAKKGGG
jgi:CRISPR-associated protein Cas7/Csd2 subtype I-C